MALRMWASSTANALNLSSVRRPTTLPLPQDASLLVHLGEVMFVELPKIDTSVTKGSGFGAVESVKATSDVNPPISGEVVEVNTKLAETPGVMNSSPYEDGLKIKVKSSSPAELDAFMGSKEYTKFCEEEDVAR